jgi:hypothetical protein
MSVVETPTANSRLRSESSRDLYEADTVVGATCETWRYHPASFAYEPPVTSIAPMRVKQEQ